MANEFVRVDSIAEDWRPVIRCSRKSLDLEVTVGCSLPHASLKVGVGEQIVEGWLVEEGVTYASDAAKHFSVMPSDIPVNYRFRKKRCRAQSCKVTLELLSPAAKETDWRVHCQERDSIFTEYSVGKYSEKHDPESRFLCQIESSSRSIDGSLARCSVGVNWKSRNSAQPLSSNVLPAEDDFGG